MSSNHDHRLLQRRVSQRLLGGFVLLILLMALLTANAVHHMSELEARMRDIVEERNRKIQLATDLLEASHNRHDALVYQALTSDPFERDNNFQLFIKWGYNVGKARNDLRALRLDAFEQDNLLRQDALIQKISILHDEISDLASQDELAAAQQKLSSELRPYNLEFITLIDQLRLHERNLNHQSLVATREATRDAIHLSLILGAALVLLAALIAFVSLRQLRKHARTICQQMEALEEAGIQLEHEASHDALTGLANRSLFYRRLKQAIAHARQEDLKVTVLYVDLDEFKPVNDQHGHAVGDSLLQVVTGRLLKSVRNTDTVARLGGDEFAVILLGIGEPEQIEQMKAKIHQDVQHPADLGEIVLHPACSIGHAVFPEDGDSMDALLHTADRHMYQAKRSRKRAGQ